MATGMLVSVEEYLNTSYDPDCDYVDGRIEERNVGEFDHSSLQTAIGSFFFVRRKQFGVHAVVEQRVQVSSTRFRVPDLCLISETETPEPVFRSPPLLVVEILSREDRMSKLLERVKDYLEFGVPCVWVIDPRTHRAWIYTASDVREVSDGILRTPDGRIELSLPEIFAALQ